MGEKSRARDDGSANGLVGRLGLISGLPVFPLGSTRRCDCEASARRLAVGRSPHVLGQTRRRNVGQGLRPLAKQPLTREFICPSRGGPWGTGAPRGRPGTARGGKGAGRWSRFFAAVVAVAQLGRLQMQMRVVFATGPVRVQRVESPTALGERSQQHEANESVVPWCCLECLVRPRALRNV